MIEAILALFLGMASHGFRFRHGLDLADEGFLWNGTLRISQGRIPIRDYKSYDPFRFYWCHAWMRVFGPGILGLRHAVAVFHVLGLWAGLVALSTVTDNVALLTLAGLVLVIWAHPRHKLFEQAMALITIWALTGFVTDPTPTAAFLAGLTVGFAGLMGRNHIAYALGAMALCVLLVWIGGTSGLFGLFARWSLGLLIGLGPMIAMFVFIPQMAATYIYQKILVFIRRDRTTMTQKAPLPWRISVAGKSPLDAVSIILQGIYFLAMVLFGLGGTICALIGVGLPPVVAVAAFTGVFYMHHAYTRSDLAHLCQAITPLLLGVLALGYAAPAPVIHWGLLVVLILTGLLVIRQIDPRLRFLENPETQIPFDLLGERIYVGPGQARFLKTVLALKDRHVGDEQMFIAPVSPTLYPVLGKVTPVRSDFMLFREDAAAQDRIIADLEKAGVNWALVQDIARGGRDDLRFRNTHSRVWNHIQTHFTPVPKTGLGAKWSFWQRKNSADGS